MSRQGVHVGTQLISLPSNALLHADSSYDPESGGGGNISADVSGHRGASVRTLGGEVTGEVTSQKGAASVVAMGQISGKISAGRDVYAWAWDKISSTADGGDSSAGISAGTHAVVTSLKSITANVQADRVAVVNAGTELSGDVTGGFSATAAARTGELSGEITATAGDAVAFALLDVTGDVTAGRHAQMFALGNVSGNLTAGGHVVTASLGGHHTGNVDAGMSGMVMGAESVSGSLQAGTTLVASSLGGVSSTANASGNASRGVRRGIRD